MQPTQKYVSVLFVNLLQPIVDLFDRLERAKSKPPNEVQASPVENGYAISIVVLCALAVESALNRTRYIRKEPARESAVSTLKRLGAVQTAKDIEEVFVVRDIIAHNHLWTAAVRWDQKKGLALNAAKQLPGYGDPKFRRVVDLKKRATRRLNLDVFPTRIHRATAVVVLKKTVEAFRFLEGLNRDYVYLGQPWHVLKGRKLVPFYKWVDSLR